MGQIVHPVAHGDIECKYIHIQYHDVCQYTHLYLHQGGIKFMPVHLPVGWQEPVGPNGIPINFESDPDHRLDTNNMSKNQIFLSTYYWAI